MNSLLKLLFVVLTIGLLGIHSSLAQNCEIRNFHHIVGEWKRVDVNEGEQGKEVWIITSDSTLVGYGIYHFTDGRTFREELSIDCYSGECFYTADVPHNEKSVGFVALECSATHFKFSNLNHDYPTRIEYYFEGDSLSVKVGDENRSDSFHFVKVK